MLKRFSTTLELTKVVSFPNLSLDLCGESTENQPVIAQNQPLTKWPDFIVGNLQYLHSQHVINQKKNVININKKIAQEYCYLKTFLLCLASF